MKCDVCNKTHLDVICIHFLHNPKIDVQICTECARERGVILSVKDIKRITSDYPTADFIPINDTDYLSRAGNGQHILYTADPDGAYKVKGLAWGHGELFVYTEEYGTTGISYPHEIDYSDCDLEDEDGEVYEEPKPRYHQKTIFDFYGGVE